VAPDSASPNSNLGAWIRRLRQPDHGPAPADSIPVDAVDLEAVDNAFGFAAEHTRRYVASAGADDGWDGPRPILVLYTKGRRTGQIRRNPLLCFEHAGQRYIIGSLGGAPKHPVWYLNLLAEPRVRIRYLSEFYEADARTVSPEERATLWPELVARYPMFGEYERLTDREIPIVHLEAVRSPG